MDLLWIFATSVIIFMMQPGFALVELGLVTHRYVVNAMLKNLVHLAVALLGFGFVGFTILFSDGNPLSGTLMSFDPNDFHIFKDSTVPLDGIRIFHIAFAAAAAAIISGAVAGRIRMSGYFLVSLFMCIAVYPSIGRLIWGKGFLHQLGMLDFAGGVVVHGVGGAAALACAAALGPRIERRKPDGGLRELTGYNIVLTGLGVFILWFAWFGFNCGSILHFTANQAMVFPIFFNTLSAAGVGFLIGLLYSYLRYGFVKPVAAIESLMAGLVSVTACCAYVNLGAALFIAAVGALIVHGVSAIVLKLRIDDPVNAFAVHALPGVWGASSIALFGSTALVHDRWNFFLVQTLGGLGCVALAFVSMYAFCRIVAATIGLRVDRESEVRGLDREKHDYENRFESEGESHESRLRDQGRAMASLSHEILGSLGAAKAQTELLEISLASTSGESNDSLRQRCIKTLAGLRRAEKIARLTLGYSRSGSQTGPSTSLMDALSTAVEMVSATHVRARVKVQIDVPGDVEVLADDTRLVQAFYNILKNACEAFTGKSVEARRIAVTLENGPHGSTLIFSDNAGGMSQETLSHVGEAFHSGKSDGLGLGLHLTRQYLEQIGLGLALESKLGEGTRILIQIPKSTIWSDRSGGTHEHLDR